MKKPYIIAIAPRVEQLNLVKNVFVGCKYVIKVRINNLFEKRNVKGC